MSRPAVLLFDLGGVVLDYRGPQRLARLLDGRRSPADVQANWASSSALIEFESGGSSAAEFADRFCREWGIGLAGDAFLREYATWLHGPYPGAVDLLRRLRRHHTIACLTNNNAFYWPRIRDDIGFGGLFHRCFTSHEMGLLKPDPAIYRRVLDDLACPPEQVAFFDDSPVNVEAARACGMTARHVDGMDALRAALDGLGVLPSAAGLP